MVAGCLARRRRTVLVRRWALLPWRGPRRLPSPASAAAARFGRQKRLALSANLTRGTRSFDRLALHGVREPSREPSGRPSPGEGCVAPRRAGLSLRLPLALHCRSDHRASIIRQPPRPRDGAGAASFPWRATLIGWGMTGSSRQHMTRTTRMRRRRRPATRAPHCCGRPCSARAAKCCSSRSRHQCRRRCRVHSEQSARHRGAPARRRSACWPRRD